jgi:hypothetical protein
MSGQSRAAKRREKQRNKRSASAQAGGASGLPIEAENDGDVAEQGKLDLFASDSEHDDLLVLKRPKKAKRAHGDSPLSQQDPPEGARRGPPTSRRKQVLVGSAGKGDRGW